MYKLMKNNETGKFDVLEVATDRVVFTSKDQKRSRAIYRKFNGGQGFGGWTPDFMFFGGYKFPCK